jgi:hypothetical protein
MSNCYQEDEKASDHVNPTNDTQKYLEKNEKILSKKTEKVREFYFINTLKGFLQKCF